MRRLLTKASLHWCYRGFLIKLENWRLSRFIQIVALIHESIALFGFGWMKRRDRCCLSILSATKLRTAIELRVIFNPSNWEKPGCLFSFFFASGCSFAAILISRSESLPAWIFRRATSFWNKLSQTHHMACIWFKLVILHRRALSRNNNCTVLGIENRSNAWITTHFLSINSIRQNLEDFLRKS